MSDTVVAEKVVVAKKMTELVYFDANNVEIRREAKGRGRPPRGAVKQENGNFHVYPVATAPAAKSDYIVLDTSGNVVSRKQKPQGRTSAGFVKQTDGPFAGHWTKTQVAVENVDTTA